MDPPRHSFSCSIAPEPSNRSTAARDRDAPPGPGQRWRRFRRTAAGGARQPGPGHGDVDRFRRRAIGRQALSLDLTPDNFRNEIARARTFTLAQEIEQLRAAGFARGGSLDNAIVVDEARVLNPAACACRTNSPATSCWTPWATWRWLARACGRFIAHRSGHALNNRLLRALFADARRSANLRRNRSRPKPPDPLAAEARSPLRTAVDMV